jgi:uncharacterized membrane protein
MSNQIVTLLSNYLKRELYSLNQNDLKIQLLSNPDYPSVKSITDTLNYFDIENIAANIPKDAFVQLPNFFLAIIIKDNKTSIAQVEVKKSFVKLLDSNGNKEKLTFQDFKGIWNGTIIAIEKNTDTIVSNDSKISMLKHPIMPFALITAFAIFSNIIQLNVVNLIYSIISATGLVIGYLIVREEIGLFSQATSKVCNSITNNTSCGEVINSKSSKIFGFLSLSDLTITYFLSLLFIISALGYKASFSLLLGVLSFPLILYTVYQQAFSIKKWCPLCLAVASLIVSQTIIAFITFDSLILDLNYSLISLFIFSLVYISWLRLKSLIVDNMSLYHEATEYLKFKRNEKLFKTLLEEEPIKESIFLNENSIILGNPNAKLTINAVTNPLCGFCTKAFESYHKLLQKHPDDIKLNVIFNVPSNDLKQSSSQVSQRIIELYKDDKEKAFNALAEWFEIREVSIWQEQFGKPKDDIVLTTLQAHKTLCDNNNISYTPATIINNYKLPKAYNIEDISFFIDNLTDISIKKSLV